MNKMIEERLGLCGIVISDEPSAVLDAAATHLSRRGVNVRYLRNPLPEDVTPFRLLVLRVRSSEVLSWAKRLLSYRGAPVVLPHPEAIERIKDRWACRQLLNPTSIKLPEALMGTPASLLSANVERLLPLVLKHRRQHRLPVSVLRRGSELREALGTYEPDVELVAEHYVEGLHYSVCFVGAATYVFHKPPLVNGVGELQLVSCPPVEILECLNCYRRVSGLSFGKADVVRSAAGEVFFVDGGVSPNLWQLPEAPKLLADHFLTFFKSDNVAENSADRKLDLVTH